MYYLLAFVSRGRYLGTALAPGDTGWISFTIDVDMMSVNDQFSTFSVDITFETSVSRIIFEHVNPGITLATSTLIGKIHVVEINEGIIDCLDFNIRVLQSVPEDLSQKLASQNGVA
jgi:hypothetical protein